MRTKKHNKYSSAWPVVKRYYRSVLPFLTIVKIFNILLAKLEEKIGAIKLRSEPYFIKIEPTNLCNLHCVGCLHAANKQDQTLKGYLGSMQFNDFTKLIDEIRNKLVYVSLYLEGESLLHNQIDEMIAYLSNNRIGSVISSNLNYLPDDLAKKIVANKLTRLVVSLDGYNEKTYNEYRRGGDYNRVIANIRKIQAEKKKQKSRYPIIEAQTINFEHFSSEDMAKIKKIASDLKVDEYLIKDELGKYYDKPKPSQKRCFWLYASPTINWNGTVQPCCFYYDDKLNNFGNIHDESLLDIWNNEKYQAAREYFKTGKKNGSLRCHNCVFFKK